MAQGFDRQQNLAESNTQVSDRTILDNLGGENISSDLLLFDGNSNFKSKLVNSEYYLSPTASPFGLGFTPGVRYIIQDLGSDRNWVAVAVGGEIGTHQPSGRANSFIAAAGVSDSVLNTGSGGTAREMVVRQDFQTGVDDSGGFFRSIGVNKVGFTNGTKLSIDDGNSYPYIVTGHDSENVFRLVLATTTPPYDVADIINPSTLGDVNNLTLTRSDTITVENLEFMNAERLITNDEVGTSSPESAGAAESESDEIDNVGDGSFLSAYSTFSQIGYIQNLTAQIKFKKSRIPRTYEDSFFDENVKIGGAIHIENSNEIQIGYPRGLDTALVSGVEYEITTRGNASVSFFNTVSGESRTSWVLGDKFTCVATTTSVGSTSRVKATTPPGLFIYNSSTGAEIRAFSGTEQPWEELDAAQSNAALNNYNIGTGSLRTVTEKIDIRRMPFYINPISNNAPIFIKATSGTNQTTTPVDGSLTEAGYTHKIGITVNGVQYYLLTEKQ